MNLTDQVSDYAGGALRDLTRPRSIMDKTLRVFRIATLNFFNNDDLLWASALTYTVTLSIVPILALAFSVLKSLGGSERLVPLLERYLALGNSQTVTRLMNMVGNVNAATLGSVGGVTLLITVISTLGTIENAFNSIWQVPSGRSYLRKFTDYVSVVFTVPLFLVAALALTASFSAQLHAGRVLPLLLPSLILWLGFFFFFIFFPYTRVRWSAALLGSFISAVLFQLGQWLYVKFWVGMASYHAIYGALATIPLLLLWLYVAWMIVLFGVEVAFAAQRGTTRYDNMPRSLNFTRYAALLTLLRLAERFSDQKMTVSKETLASELRVPPVEIERLIDGLKAAGLVVESSPEDERGKSGLFLTADPGTVKLGDAFGGLQRDSWGDSRIADLMGQLGDFETRWLNAITLRDLQSGAGDSLIQAAAQSLASERGSG